MIKRLGPQTYLALGLLMPLSLLAASCSSDSDSDTTAPVAVTDLLPARAEATTALTRTTAPTTTETTTAPTTTLTPTTTEAAITTAAPTTAPPTTAAPTTTPPTTAAPTTAPPTTAAPTTTPPTTAAPTTAPPSTTTTTTTLPANRAIAITTGGFLPCVLLRDGTLSCPGNLGLEPVQMSITDATAITIGWGHSCALHQDGTISCWGFNEFGQLGNGNSGYHDEYETMPIFSSVPVEVVGITDATAITAGEGFSCALHQTGTISCWGTNRYGELGNGQTGDDANSSIPVQVTGISDATAITAGFGHSCALHQDGTISCWGFRGEPVPVRVVGISDAIAISAGGSHSCALRQDGTISCWGGNSHGQLGNGQIGVANSSSIPVQVTGISDATAITAGFGHSCALHQDGTISCWGNNWSWFLNDETDARGSSVPVRVAGISDAIAISAGDDHSCALRQGGTMSCWNNNDFVPFDARFGG